MDGPAESFSVLQSVETARSGISSYWKRLWSEPEPELRDAGLSGELLTARIRLTVVLVLITIPLTYRLRAPLPLEGELSLIVLIVALVVAALIYKLVSLRKCPETIGFVSSIADVSQISILLALMVFMGRPLVATNSQFTFSVYFLALAATSLRFDQRICLAAGVTAILQYMSVVLLARLLWPLTSPDFYSIDYGRFGWHTQMARVILLSTATYLSMVIVGRAQDLRRLSVRDPLTGLVNRGFFEERLQEELSRAMRSGESVVVALLDIDHFKQVNDSYGHGAGDLVLQSVALTVKTFLRTSDVVARYGGDEFALILPGMEHEDTAVRMNDLRIAISKMSLLQSLSIPQLTVSIGLGILNQDGKTAEELMQSADRRLYAAKSQGRNRVVIQG